MPRLGREERDYCKKHRIPLDRLFDATGMKPATYNPLMEQDKMWAAYGVTPCRSAGHSLRNRHGTCLMCNEQTVAHLLRAKLSGYLYVAWSNDADLMKLGFSNDPKNRMSIANYEGWGGFDDWFLVASGWSKRAGRFEADLKHIFQPRHRPLAWVRNGQPSVTTEAFDVGSELLEFAVSCLRMYSDCGLQVAPEASQFACDGDVVRAFS